MHQKNWITDLLRRIEALRQQPRRCGYAGGGLETPAIGARALDV